MFIVMFIVSGCDLWLVSSAECQEEDNLLHIGKIHSDVTDYDGRASGASGCGGGFPCQAGVVESVLLDCCCRFGCDFAPSCKQGVSTAGSQLGLQDPRTSLVYHCFRVYDALPAERQGPFSNFK